MSSATVAVLQERVLLVGIVCVRLVALANIGDIRFGSTVTVKIDDTSTSSCPHVRVFCYLK